MILYTWTQELLFHEHIHCIVPGAGLDAKGQYVQVKYLGAYVARSAIGDKRMVSISESQVTFRCKDRKSGAERKCKVAGVEFIRRYLRHMLPAKMHSVRYGGFCHAAAKETRRKVLEGCSARNPAKSEIAVAQTQAESVIEEPKVPQCPCCKQPMIYLGRLAPLWRDWKRWEQARGRSPPSHGPPKEAQQS
jgi:hypothetical protein